MRKIYFIIITMLLLPMVSCSYNSKEVGNNEEVVKTFVVNQNKLNRNIIGSDVKLSQTEESISAQNTFINSLYNRYDIDWIEFQIDYNNNIQVVVKTKDENIKKDNEKLKEYITKDLEYFKNKIVTVKVNDETVVQFNVD